MLYSRVNLRFGKIFQLVLVLFAVFFVQCFSYNPALSAQADTIKTPEAKYYNAEPTEKDKQLIDNTKNNLKDIGENVRE